jgi:rare lipoprotein A
MGAAPGKVTSDSTAKDSPVPKNKHIPAKVDPPYQVGRASWYGLPFQGRETASGEPYDMHKFTAAHRGLPLGSWVRVTNLKNNRSVIVRINDRGPVIQGRIIDLSYEAAQELKFAGEGIGKVRIDVVGVREADAVARLHPVPTLGGIQ